MADITHGATLARFEPLKDHDEFVVGKKEYGRIWIHGDLRRLCASAWGQPVPAREHRHPVAAKQRSEAEEARKSTSDEIEVDKKV